MFFRKCRPTNLEHISDVYSLDWKFGANSIADGYRAYDKQNKRHCALWITRERLSEADRLTFYQHIRYLRKGGLERISRYGCDIDGVGYVALPILAVKSLDYDDPDVNAKASRLLRAFLKVEGFHLQGLVCGNLCADSFMIDSDNQVHFVGYAGGDLEQTTGDSSGVYQTFRPPEEINVGQRTQVADVYALAVIGLKLFGATFPEGEIAPLAIPECLKTLDPKAPLWLQAVLPRVLSCKPEHRYKDASQLLAAIAIQAERQRELPAESRDAGSALHNTREQADAVLALPRDAVRLQAKVRRLARTPSFVIGVTTALLSSILGISWIITSLVESRSHATSGHERVGLIAGASPFTGVLGQTEQNPNTRESLAGSLRALVQDSEYPQTDSGAESRHSGGSPSKTSPSSDEPLVDASQEPHTTGPESSVSIKRRTERQWIASLERAKLAGFRHSAEILEYLIHAHHTINPQDITRLIAVVDSTLTKEKRRELVISYESVDPDLSYMLAAALSLDLAEPGLFRDLLVRGAKKQALVGTSPIDSISTAALIASIPSARELFLEDVSTSPAALSDKDVWWLLEILTLQRADQLRFFASSARVSQLNLGVRRFFLDAMTRATDLEISPIEALFKCLRDKPDMMDIQKFSQWYDIASVRVLLATLLITGEPEVARGALDALSNKSTENPTLDAAISFVRDTTDAPLVSYASFVGGVGLVDSLSREETHTAFASLRDKPQASKLCTLLLHKGSPRLVSAILDALGDTINPVLLVDLLKHPDKNVRLQIIPFVKEISLASSWQQVVDAYLSETDTEVKATYESHIPRIRGS